ncbi:unnamed protein product [Ilex paraguariensis]
MNEPSLHELVSKLEPFLRNLVREELECAIFSSSRSSLNQIESSGVRALQLHFTDKLPSILFTGSRIVSGDGEPVKIVILDACSQNTITSGPLSSIKIQLVVLDGDFDSDDQEDWTEKAFNAKIVKERQGKRPLVTGDLLITLRDGVGYIGDISFTDNSSWIRSRRFRLGAKVQNICTEIRIREAVSEAFVVKDHRGESYKKHHPPSLGDDVWRLEKIAKDGAFHKRLALHKIYTVKELLRLHITDPSLLRNILGGGVSDKTWTTIIGHAADCIVDDDKLYMYRAAERVVLVFNSIFKVVGATFDSQNYQSLDKLNNIQKRLVEDWKRHAYKNLNDLVPIDDPSVVGCPTLVLSPQADPFGCPTLGLQNDHFLLALDQQEMQLGSNDMASSSPFAYKVEDANELEVSMAQSSHQMQMFTSTMRNSFTMRDFLCGPDGGGCSWGTSGSMGPVVFTGHVAADDNIQDETTWQGNGLFQAPYNKAADIVSTDFGIHIPRSGTPKARWCKLRAAITWGILVRRDVTAKRMARLLFA